MSELNLFLLEQEYLDIARQLTDGELTPELEQALAMNKENLEIKSAKYAYVVKKFEGESNLIEVEIERLAGLKNKRDKAIETLKEKVKQAMVLYGVEKIESQNITLSFRKSTKLDVFDESLIPKKYKKKVTTDKVLTAAIKNDLLAGAKIKGAKLIEGKNLQIR